MVKCVHVFPVRARQHLTRREKMSLHESMTSFKTTPLYHNTSRHKEQPVN